MDYKYNEFTEEEFKYWCDKYGGKFVYPYELEAGTKFHVENGFWYGEIVEANGDKYILVEKDNKINISPKYYLWVTLGKERNELSW